MAKAKDKVYDAAGNVKPYVDRAMNDEKLRNDVMSAFGTAKDLYSELVGGRSPVTMATRVATDEDVRERLKEAVEDLRDAAGRLQGRKDHSGRNTTLLVAGIALGLLFNPVTGPETRKWLKELVGGDDQLVGPRYGDTTTANGGAES
jgi:gas vesicle protein